MPAALKLTVRVAVPLPPLIVVGDTVPALVDSVTVPLKPLRLDTVMVLVKVAPGATFVKLFGLALTMKSFTVTGTFSVCPLLDVTVAT